MPRQRGFSVEWGIEFYNKSVRMKHKVQFDLIIIIIIFVGRVLFTL